MSASTNDSSLGTWGSCHQFKSLDIDMDEKVHWRFRRYKPEAAKESCVLQKCTGNTDTLRMLCLESLPVGKTKLFQYFLETLTGLANCLLVLCRNTCHERPTGTSPLKVSASAVSFDTERSFNLRFHRQLGRFSEAVLTVSSSNATTLMCCFKCTKSDHIKHLLGA